MDLFIPAVALLALVKKFIDFAKYITNRDVNGALTQIVVWASGVVAVCLYAQTDWADAIVFGDLPLSTLNLASQIAIGLGIASAAGVTTDFIKSRDDSDSAKMPSLLPGEDT